MGIHCAVGLTVAQQALVAAVADYAAVFHDYYPVVAAGIVKIVGYEYARFAGEELVDGILNFRGHTHVKGARRLVHEDDIAAAHRR